jgi:hypothetical protein
MLHSIRSERQLMEQISFSILFRWFVGLGLDDPVWDVTVFSKNRQRLLEGHWTSTESRIRYPSGWRVPDLVFGRS